MTRGQGEFLGASVLLVLTVLMTYVASEWILAISSTAAEAVKAVEHSREVLDVVLETNGIKVVNRGPGKSYIDLAYIESENGVLVVRKVGVSIASGEVNHINLGYPGIRKVCIETGNGNTFCSAKVNSTPYALHTGTSFMSIERVQPKRLKPVDVSDANHVPYRDRRVVAPGTSFYVFAVPIDHVTVVYSDEEILKDLPIYINTNPQSDRYILVRWRGTDPIIDPRALVDHDDSTRGTEQLLGTHWVAVCVDLGSTIRGWLYLYLRHHAWVNDPWMYIAVSNNTCTNMLQGKTIFRATKDNIYNSGPYALDVKGVWLFNARSVLINTSAYYEFYSIEFYPYNVTKTVLTFPSPPYTNPIETTVSVFALSNTYIQVIERL